MNNLEKKKVIAMTVTKWMEDIKKKEFDWGSKVDIFEGILTDEFKYRLSTGSIAKLADSLYKGEIYKTTILTKKQCSELLKQCREFLNSGSLFPMLQTLEISQSYGMNIDVVDLATFRKIHKHNTKSSDFNRFLALVYDVELYEDGISFKIEGKDTKKRNGYAMFFDGRTGWIDSKKRFRQYNLNNSRNVFPVSISKNQGKFMSERVMRGLLDVYCGVMLADYDKVVCNVLNLSGACDTCCSYGITQDFHPYNIEWCRAQDNANHSKMMHTIYDYTEFNNKLIDGDGVEWCIGLSALDPVSLICSTNKNYNKLIDDVMDLDIVQSTKTRRV